MNYGVGTVLFIGINMMDIIRQSPSSFNVLNTDISQGLGFHTLLLNYPCRLKSSKAKKGHFSHTLESFIP